MKSTCFAGLVALALFSGAYAQQSPDPPTGDTIGHPPPLPGPPPLSEPVSKAQPAAPASTPPANDPAPKGYTGAYQPAGTPPTPYSKGPSGPDTVAQDGGALPRAKAVRCGVTAKETDGSTTCIGIPDQSLNRKSHRR